jgi:hypothetical protein
MRSDRFISRRSARSLNWSRISGSTRKVGKFTKSIAVFFMPASDRFFRGSFDFGVFFFRSVMFFVGFRYLASQVEGPIVLMRSGLSAIDDREF